MVNISKNSPQGICCGGVVYNGSFPLIFAAWGDDETTDEIDGYIPDQRMSFRFWDRSADEIYRLDSVTDYRDEISIPHFDDSPYSIVNIGKEIKTTMQNSSSEFCLYSNYPNPFNSTTDIVFNLREENYINIVIFDQGGRIINTLCDQMFPAGRHILPWNGKNTNGNRINSGIYFCRIQMEYGNEIIKMVMEK